MANIKKIKVSGTSYDVYDTTAMHNIATNPAVSIISEISNASYKSATAAVGIGQNSTVSGTNSVAIGASSTAASGGTAVGMQAKANSSQAAAFGFSATASAAGAVQIGQGTNNNANSLQFKNYPLVDENGKIPMERLHSDLIVTTMDPLPDPNGLSVATTQLYQGPDSDEYQKNHMYSVVEDRNLMWGMIVQHPFQIVPEPEKNIKIDTQKFLNWVKANVGHFQGVANFTTPTSSSTAVQVIYQAATGHFLIAVSGFVFEYAGGRQVDTGYTTLQQIKDNLGIDINPEVWNPQPTMPPVPFVVMTASTTGFGVVGPLVIDQSAPNSVVISDPEKFTAKLRSTITGDSGEQYTLKFDKTEQISFWKNDEAQWGFTVLASGQTKATIYANSASKLLSDWGVNVLLPESFIRLQMIQLVNTYGHRWAEIGADLRALPGYNEQAEQVLKNNMGTIQWGVGGGGGSSQDTSAVYRGEYANWETVPETATYKADVLGDTKPHNGNFMIVADSGDYIISEAIPCRIIITADTTSALVRTEVTRDGHMTGDESNVENLPRSSWAIGGYISDMERAFRIEFEPDTTGGGTYRIDIKSETNSLYLGGTKYDKGDLITSIHAGGAETVRYDQTLDYKEVEQTLEGKWAFQYNGDWETNGKNGWEPAFELGGGGSGSTAWGSITGTLANQTDLQGALNAKQNTVTYDATTKTLQF